MKINEGLGFYDWRAGLGSNFFRLGLSALLSTYSVRKSINPSQHPLFVTLSGPFHPWSANPGLCGQAVTLQT